MKSMILVLNPKECCNLMNGKLSLLVRKIFPKYYIGWVYIYCTKGKPFLYYGFCRDVNFETTIGECEENYFISKVKHKEISEKDYIVRNLNGKVVAKFWCNNVEEIKFHCLTKTNTYGVQRIETTFTTQTLSFKKLKELSCLTCAGLMKYLNDTDGYAIHITKLEIFDNPKELGEFYKVGVHKDLRDYFTDEKRINGKWCIPLKKAPQSWCYVEEV